jgi:hypothetical protein
MRVTGLFAAAALTLVSAGCAQTAGIGDILGGVLGGGTPAGMESGAVVAEVQGIDTNNQVLQFRTEQGQNVNIRFDSRTRVVYQQQEYPVTSLERGDVVRATVSQTNNNEYYTSYIEVQQSVQDRTGGTGSGTVDNRLYQLQGSVDQIDYSRGLFTMRTSNGSILTVAMPYNPRVADKDRFERIRRGDNVRVEGRYVSQNRLELERFY